MPLSPAPTAPPRPHRPNPRTSLLCAGPAPAGGRRAPGNTHDPRRDRSDNQSRDQSDDHGGDRRDGDGARRRTRHGVGRHDNRASHHHDRRHGNRSARQRGCPGRRHQSATPQPNNRGVRTLSAVRSSLAGEKPRAGCAAGAPTSSPTARTGFSVGVRHRPARGPARPGCAGWSGRAGSWCARCGRGGVELRVVGSGCLHQRLAARRDHRGAQPRPGVAVRHPVDDTDARADAAGGRVVVAVVADPARLLRDADHAVWDHPDGPRDPADPLLAA